MSRIARAVPQSALGGGAEFDLIRRFLRDSPGAGGRGVIVGPGDDCAVVRGERVALSTDLSIEDVHFRRAWLSAEEIGFRAAAASLSDLAAVAAAPIGILVAIAVAPEDAGDFAAAIMAGAGSAAADAGAALIGGDTSRSPGPLILDVVAAGAVREPVLRGGARPGDAVWVTGRLGGAGAAAAAWLTGAEPVPEARAAFARPTPRLREARWLAKRGLLHAMIDLSDGLAGDAGHIAAASGVRIVLEADAIPVHEGAGGAASRGALELALRGGEDYELLFAAEQGAVESIANQFAREFRTPLTRIGSAESGSGLSLRDAQGMQSDLAGGFDHFRRGAP